MDPDPGGVNNNRKCLLHRGIGLAAEFSFEKILRNRLGMVSVIPRKEVLIPRFTEESIPKLGTERNEMKKLILEKSCSSEQN